MKIAFAFVICTSLLLACSSGVNPFDENMKSFTENDQREIESLLKNPEKLRNFLSGTTNRAPHPSFTQIGYFSPNGQYFLAYPGNKRVVRGRWSVSKQGNLCFSYRTEPWDCSHPQYDLTSDTAQIVDGDVFNLSWRVVLPRQIPTDRGMTIEDVMKWFGMENKSFINKVAWAKSD